MNLNEHYRSWLHIRRPDCGIYTRGEDVPLNAECARLSRDKDSHRGISQRTELHELEAGAANQDFLEEVSLLTNVEYLALEWPVTATDLSPLQKLAKLRT